MPIVPYSPPSPNLPGVVRPSTPKKTDYEPKTRGGGYVGLGVCLERRDAGEVYFSTRYRLEYPE